jgi:hypothetical protein
LKHNKQKLNKYSKLFNKLTIIKNLPKNINRGGKPANENIINNIIKNNHLLDLNKTLRSDKVTISFACLPILTSINIQKIKQTINK